MHRLSHVTRNENLKLRMNRLAVRVIEDFKESETSEKNMNGCCTAVRQQKVKENTRLHCLTFFDLRFSASFQHDI